MAPDGRGVSRGGGFEPCTLRREVIEVKGKPPMVEDVLVTPRGPVVSPGFDDGLPVLSMRAVWLDARPARGFLTAHKARSLEAFRREFEQWPLLPQNVAYADIDGHIAWQLVGEVPRRRKGFGTLPLYGSDPETGWFPDTVPFAADAARHRPGDAATSPAPTTSPCPTTAAGPILGVDWLDGYRAGRIIEALADRDDWDVASSLRLQLDEVSMPWREVRDVVLAIDPQTEEARFAVELLRAWDGVVSANSPAATVYEAFIAEMWQRVAAARAPKASGVCPRPRLHRPAAGIDLRGGPRSAPCCGVCASSRRAGSSAPGRR